MDRKMFEAGYNKDYNKAHDMNNELDSIEKRAAEIKGKPETAVSSKEKTAAEKEIIKEWEDFLKDCFPEKKFDLSALEIPKRTPEEEKEFTRLQFRSGSLSDEAVFLKCKEFFEAWKDTDKSLDDVAVKKSIEDSFIWVRDTESADEKHKNKSANMIDKEGLDTESLGDRLLHELKYFKETGEHLDKKTVTITSSRDAAGGVWVVDWDDSRMQVRRSGPGGHDGGWRPRQVVSSPTKSEK